MLLRAESLLVLLGLPHGAYGDGQPARRSAHPLALGTMGRAVPGPAANAFPTNVPASIAADGVWAEIAQVNPRWAPAAIYDPVRDRLIVFGGGGNAPGFVDVWSVSLGSEPVWVRLSPTGIAPPELDEHSAIYDPVGDRMIAFGGRDEFQDAPTNRVWALTLGATPEWTEISAAGTPPAPRQGQAAIYDPLRSRMVVFGGLDGAYTRFADTWELTLSGTPTWNPIAPGGTAPDPRHAASAVYDPSGDRMLVFGGETDLGMTSDVHALNLTGFPMWSELKPAGGPPPARTEQSAVMDPSHQRMLVFGGSNGNTWFQDVWALDIQDAWPLDLSDGTSWAELTPEGPLPPARNHAAAAFDDLRGRLLIFGGGDGSYNDVWALSLHPAPAWSSIDPVGTPPGFREFHSSIYDPVRHRMITYAGDSTVWLLDLAGTPLWHRLAIPGPKPPDRVSHGAVYDPVRDRMIVWAGYNYASGSLNDVWALTLSGTPTWTQIFPSGIGPVPLPGRGGVYDAARDRILVFTQDEHVWGLTLSGTPAWSPVTAIGTPPSLRYDQACLYDPVRDRVLIFGGRGFLGGTPELNDVWELTLDGTSSWSQVFPSGTPPGVRSTATILYDPLRDRMVLYGGVKFQTTYADVRYLSLSGTPVWSSGPIGGFWRAAHSAVYDAGNDRMVVFGGFWGNGNPLADAWTLSWGEALSVAPATGHAGIALAAGFPNPAPGRFTIRFTSDRTRPAAVEIFDVGGRRVRLVAHGVFGAGVHDASWDGMGEDGRLAPPGVYSCVLRSEGTRVMRRLVIAR